MVAEPCSVQPAQLGSSSEQNKLSNADKKLTDSLWAVASNRDREHKETGLTLEATQIKSEELFDKVQNESSYISWKTISARTRVTHLSHNRGGKARHHSRNRQEVQRWIGHEPATDHAKLFQIIMKTLQRKNPFIGRSESGDRADQDGPDSV